MRLHTPAAARVRPVRRRAADRLRTARRRRAVPARRPDRRRQVDGARRDHLRAVRPGRGRRLGPAALALRRAPACEPEVQLEFSLRGVRQRVTRSPEYPRPKRRGDGHDHARRAQVHLERGRAGAGSAGRRNKAEVGEMLADDLGLTREQFTQVVLLPQGEFMRFLRANDDERRTLLTKLFGTQLYDRITDELDRRRMVADPRSRRRRQAAARCGIGAAGRGRRPRPPTRRTSWPRCDAACRDERLDALGRELRRRGAARARPTAAARADAGRAARATARAPTAARRAAAAASSPPPARYARHEQTARRVRAGRARAGGGRAGRAGASADRGAATTPSARSSGAGTACSTLAPDAEPSVAAPATAATSCAAARRRPRGSPPSSTPLVAREQAALTRAQAAARGRRGVELRRDRDRRAAGRRGSRAARRARGGRGRAVAQRARAAAAPRRRCAARAPRSTDAARGRRARWPSSSRSAAAARDAPRGRLRAATSRRSTRHLRLVEARLANMAAELADGLVDGEPCAVCGALEHPAPAAPAPGAATRRRRRRGRASARAHAERDRDARRRELAAIDERRAALRRRSAGDADARDAR